MALEEPLSNLEPVVEDAPFPGADDKPQLLWRREWYSWITRFVSNLTADLALKAPIASPTFTGTVTVSGGQIAFPATQNASSNANTLDDYEEGTFTPTIAFGGGSTGVVYITQIGRYTKMGRVVFFELRVTLSNNGSSTGNAVIGGLPFTAASTFYAAVSMWATNISQGGVAVHYQPLVEPGSSTIILYYNASGNSLILNEGNVLDSGDIILSGHYAV